MLLKMSTRLKKLFLILVIMITVIKTFTFCEEEKVLPLPEVISSEQLYKKIESMRTLTARPSILILDTTPISFIKEHIEFAIPIDPNKFADYIEEIKKYEEVIVYCHCEDAEFSLIAASELIVRGVKNVKVLESYKRWKEDGFPIITRRLEKPEDVPSLDTEKFLQIDASDFYIYDVRERKEFEKEHIPGSINVPLGEFLTSENVKGLPEKGLKVVVCKSGHRSSIAVQDLIERGVKNIYNLPGGIVEWKKKGLPLED